MLIDADLKLRDSSRRSQRLWGKAVPRKQSSKHGVETPRTTINDLSNGLEPEGFAQNVEYDKNSDDDDDGITSGTISDGSPMAPSCTIAALQSSSPNSANFLAQYMADQISCRASLPVHKIQQTSDREEPNSQQRGIENMWKSAPSSVSLLKKSSFLLRRPVEDELLYG